MSDSPRQLEDLSLVTNNFGESEVFEDILGDWFQFLGGKPGEVFVVDCGSDRETQEVYWKLFQARRIDKLQVIQADHEDNAGGKETGYIQEYAAAFLASKAYLLFFHADTLPYREGHDNWLEQALQYLERDDVFAVSGASNLPCLRHDAWPGWYFSDKCSLNFALMKRATFIRAVHEFAGDYVLSGFKGLNPAHGTRQDRFLIEVAFERYMRRHNVSALCKIEDPTWTIFHTNTHGAQLKKTREQYLARRNIEPFLNLGYSHAEPIPSRARYYGQPPVGTIRNLRIRFGQSPLGPYWRNLKRKLRAEF